MNRSSRAWRLALALGITAVLVVPVGWRGAATPVRAAITSVTIAGDFQSELGCSADYQPDCATTHLTYDSNDDLWQGTWTLPAGSWHYKAAIDDSWDENYGAGAVANGSNIALSLLSSTVVKFYFDPNSHWVTDSQNSRIVTAVGDFQSELGCSADWDPSCLRSWLEDIDGDGTYTRTTTALNAGDYEAKATISESWDENYGAGGVAGGANIPFTVPANGAPMKFKFVSGTNTLTIEVVDDTAPTTTDVAVYLREGGQVNSYPVTVSWSASDDISANANLTHRVQSRRWVNGSWTAWSNFDSVTGTESTVGALPFWRTLQFRVRSRDEAGHWGAWALSNDIVGTRRQERKFSLGPHWTITPTAGAMKVHTANSSTPGASAQAHFTGDGAAVVMPAGPGLGTTKICIDPGTGSESCKTVNLATFSPSGPRRLVAAFTDLTAGVHVLRIEVVTGTVKLDGAVLTK